MTNKQQVILDFMNCVTDEGWKIIEAKRTPEKRIEIVSNWVESFEKLQIENHNKKYSK